jgi:hypothetical protein
LAKKILSHGRRILAQVDIHFSNSIIESWWRQLKHQWLFLNALDTIQSGRKLVAFYVEQHNEIVPHSAFEGQTPGENNSVEHFVTRLSKEKEGLTSKW